MYSLKKLTIKNYDFFNSTIIKLNIANQEIKISMIKAKHTNLVFITQ